MHDIFQKVDTVAINYVYIKGSTFDCYLTVGFELNFHYYCVVLQMLGFRYKVKTLLENL